jgi:hypothetical protein
VKLLEAQIRYYMVKLACKFEFMPSTIKDTVSIMSAASFEYGIYLNLAATDLMLAGG